MDFFRKILCNFGTPLPLRGGFSAATLCRLVLAQFSLRSYSAHLCEKQAIL